jgi:dTDP-4-dehydrorhamnose 3,5-epimerase-like enzyme
MIEGVVIRDVKVHRDERGALAERFSANFGDDLCHLYTCSVRRGVAKAFHAHLLQTDRFTPIVGVTKVGLVDVRGPLHKWFGSSMWEAGHYLGVDGTRRPFDEVWPTDAEWYERVGESPTFLQQQTVILDAGAPTVLFIPPGIAHGIYCLSGEESAIINAPTVAFRPEAPDELRLSADEFGFEWAPRSA